MIPRIKVGKGVTGAVRYVLSEGKDGKGNYRTEPKGENSRVAWMSGLNLGFTVETAADIELARRVMEFDAVNQASRTKPCEKDCVHVSLGWRKGEQPTREQMEEAAQQALTALGMGNAKAIIVAHNDEPYAHLHIVASKINPATGLAYDLKSDRLKLSKWAERYERDHGGGIVCLRREVANQLRDAIDRRDATAVLTLLTRQRATFKGADLERALGKQIKNQLERAQFAEKVLSHAETVKLADQPNGRPSRYTTRGILIAEGQVLLAAKELNAATRHAIGLRGRQRVLARPEFATISREQARAFAHATEAGGLALIDGQAGTGKSFTIAAIRQAYTDHGHIVIGLAPTNAVAQDMRASGFDRADTIQAELFKLNNRRTGAWNERTVLMVDEAAMIDTELMAQLTRRAEEAKAKLILIGDDRQLSSIDRGGMFGVLKDQYGAAELTEVRRQHKQDERRAAELMAEGNFSTALAMYDDKGAIHWQHNQEAAREALVEQWTKDSAANPSQSRFVFAYTNADVDQLNADIRQVRKDRGELGDDHRFETKHGPADFAKQDRIQITGTDKARDLINGAAGVIESIEGAKITVKLDGPAAKKVEIDAEQFKDFRHGYAGTIYKGQGRTLDQTYLYHSEHWRSSAGYVALTRHKDKTEIFVARDTAENVTQLARQMARVDDRRAASHFHQVGTPLVVERITTAELPKIKLPEREQEPDKIQQPAPAQPRPLDWAESPGMVAQQKSAIRAARRAERAQVQAHGPIETPRRAVPPPANRSKPEQSGPKATAAIAPTPKVKQPKATPATPKVPANSQTPRPAGKNPEQPQNWRLSADQILASANDPALRALYNKGEEQRGTEQKRTAENIPAETSTGSGAGNPSAPPEKSAEQKRFEEITARFTRENLERHHDQQRQPGRRGPRGGRRR